MSWLTTIGIAVGLAMDAFAVSVATSVTLPRLTGRHIFRFAWHFGLFQAMMLVLGWLCGRTIVQWVSAWDHWLAFGLLGFVGLKAIVDAVGDKDHGSGEAPDAGAEQGLAAEGCRRGDPTRGWSLVVLSVATSIDAFAVGLSLAWLQTTIWAPVLIIGVVTAALTVVGMFLGRRLGARFGRRMAIVGGVVLIAIGVKILVEHLCG